MHKKPGYFIFKKGIQAFWKRSVTAGFWQGQGCENLFLQGICMKSEGFFLIIKRKKH